MTELDIKRLQTYKESQIRDLEAQLKKGTDDIKKLNSQSKKRQRPDRKDQAMAQKAKRPRAL